MKWSKSLPALEVFSLKNGFNSGKDLGHMMRLKKPKQSKYSAKVDDLKEENFESPLALFV